MIRSLIGILAIPQLTKILNVTDDMWAYRTFTYAQTAFNQISALSDLVVNTDATNMNVVCGTTLSAFKIANASISVYVNGIFNQLISFTSAENNTIVTKAIILPAGIKNVMFRLGSEELSSGTILGQYIGSIIVTTGTFVKNVSVVRKSNRIVVVGDSISVGVGTTRPETKGYIPLMRDDNRLSTYEIASYGWGSNSMGDFFSNTAKRSLIINNIVDYMNGADTKVVVFCIATNDYGLNKSSAINYQTFTTAFFNELAAAIPGIIIKSITAFTRSNEVQLNNFNNTLPDYRTAQLAAGTGVANIETYAGTSICTLGDTAADLLHLNNVANAKVAEYITRNLLGITQDPPILPNGQYFKSANSSTGFITLPNSTTTLSLIGKSTTITFIAQRVGLNSALNIIFGQGTGTGAFFFGFNNSSGFRVGVNGTAAGYTDLTTAILNVSANEWHHWGITKNGLTYEIYQDGYLAMTYTSTLSQSKNDTSSTIGGFLTNYGLVNLDRFRIYNVILTQAQIRADKLNSNLSDFTNLIASYDFEGNANDISGNGNNGTVGAAVTFPIAP